MSRGDLEALIAIVGRNAQHAHQAPGVSSASSYFKRMRASPRFVGEACSVRCPGCAYNMFEVSTHGIVLDFCLTCQSLWLDEGELNRALDEAREHGALDVVPADPSANHPAAFIRMMLDHLAD